MKKAVSLLAVFALVVSMAAQTVVAEETTQNDDEQVLFLSLTKTAEPLSDLTTNLTVITEEEIKEKKATDLGEIIEGELGVAYKSYGPLGQSQSIFMRGSKAGQVLVLVDGRQVNDIGTGGGADFTAIPASMIERVEIIRGSGAAMYGTGAFGGVINVITKKADYTMPNTFSDEMSVALNNKSNNSKLNFNPYFSYGTFKTINAGIIGSYATDKLSILLAPSLLSSDGYRPNSFYNSKNIFGKIGFKPTKNSEFVLSGQAYNADIGNPGSLSSPSYTDKLFEDNNYLKLDYSTTIKDFDIFVTGYNANYTKKGGDLESSYVDWYTGDVILSPFYNGYNTNNTGIKGNVTYKEFLTLGLEWDKIEYKQKDLLSNTEVVDKNRETLSAYIQYIMTFDTIENLTLIPVLRGDKSNDFGNVVTPAVSAIYKFTDEIKLSGNASKVWNAPTFGQLYNNYYGSANPNLKPEKGWSYDLGIEYSKNKFTGMITGFYIDSEDLIVSNKKTGYKNENIDKAKQYGYEIGLKHNLSKEFSHKVNYTYTKAEDVKAKQTLAYIPLHVLNYMLTLKPASIEGLKLTLDLSYNTTIYANDKGDYLDDYCIVNLRADYQIMKYVSLWAKIDNLTNNETYQLTYDYPMPGVTGTVGIDVKF